jgi:hypothetical protein
MLGTAVRYGYDTFELRTRSPLPAGRPTDWTMEVRVPEWQQRAENSISGARAGSLIGAAAVFLKAATCKPTRGEGPNCRILIVLAPPAAIVGMLAGGIAGRAQRVHEWLPVTVLR